MYGWTCILCLLVCSTIIQCDPKPNPSSVVKVGDARFTVLTSRLIRMEWGIAVDAATFTFINRNLPKPEFSVNNDGQWTVIKTEDVMVFTRS